MDFSGLFTVPFFAPTSIHHSLVPVSADLTILPLNSPSINERVLDLAKVQSLLVNNSEWSLSMIVELLKESMSNVNFRSLNGNYTGRHDRVVPTLSLPEILTLDVARYGLIPSEDLFPCMERLIVKVDTKRPIP